MKSLTVTDGGARYSLLLREDTSLPSVPEQERLPYKQFLDWWRAYADKMHIPYSWRVAEPQGIRIIKRLLEKHSMEELKTLAVHFFLDYGDRLREDPRHFSIFTSMLPQMEKELEKREGRL